MFEEEVTYNDICKSQELGQKLFPGYRNYTTALALCQNVGGTMLQIENEAQQNSALELMKTSSTCSDTSEHGGGRIWIALWDRNQESYKLVSGCRFGLSKFYFLFLENFIFSVYGLQW